MRLRLLSPFILLPIAALWWLSSPVPTEYFVRPNGGTTTQCTGTTNADYPGTGTAQPCAFKNLQDGFDVVQFGDTLTLLQGATFTAPGVSSPYRLRAKSGGTGTDADYIIVRTSGFASLPSGRVVDNTAMAKIVALGTGGAIITNEDNVRYWKFIGIEITNQSSGTAAEHAYTLVDLGQSGANPNHFWFDRCYVHPQEDGTNNYYRSSTRGFGINNVNVFKLTKSRVSGFLGRYAHDHNDLIDSEAFATASVGTNYLIDDNYLQAYFNTFFLGGGSIAPTTNTGVVQASPVPTLTTCTLSTVVNLSIGDYISFPQPNGARNANARITNISGTTITYTALDLYSESLGQRIQATAPAVGAVARWGPNSNSPIDNITITHNTFDLPTAYCQWEYDQTNGVRMPKGFFEIKWVDHLLMEGNIFQGWPSWFAINAVNQTGNSPWLTVRNATFRSNWIRQFAIGSLNHAYGNPLGQADWHMTQRGSNITYDNNLFTEDFPFPIDLGGWGPRVMQQGWGPDGLTITHNTWINSSLENVAMWAASGPTANFTFRDNIAYYNNYGIGCSYGAQTFAACWPAWMETKNIIVNVRGDASATFPNSYSAAPGTNPVGWVGPLNNSQIAGWALSVSSPYHNGGSDGSDPGVNVPVLLAAIGGQPAPTPTPTPTFTISGTVTLSGSGLGNTTVNLLRSSDRVILSATTTGGDGSYGLSGVAGSSVIVVPVKPGYLFTPSEVLISPLNSNRTQDFTASAPSPTPTPTATPTATPTPTPTATPTPTVTPTPTPTPPPPSPTPTPTPGVLPICGPNQVIGSPAVCRCIPIPPRKVIGNPRRCKP